MEDVPDLFRLWLAYTPSDREKVSSTPRKSSTADQVRNGRVEEAVITRRFRKFQDNLCHVSVKRRGKWKQMKQIGCLPRLSTRSPDTKEA